MDNAPPHKVLVPPDVLFRNLLDGESVILNLKTGTYFGLDEVRTRMWAALTNSESVQEAFASLLAEYAVDAERLQRNLDEFVNRLAGRGLLEMSG